MAHTIMNRIFINNFRNSNKMPQTQTTKSISTEKNIKGKRGVLVLFSLVIRLMISLCSSMEYWPSILKFIQLPKTSQGVRGR